MNLYKNKATRMSKTKKFEDFNTQNVNENLEEITSDVNGITVYGDGEELDLNIATIGEVKQWIIENQLNFGEIMVVDDAGDSIIVSKEDTMEDLELLFSDIDNVEMEEEDCGCSSDTKEYEEYEEYEEGSVEMEEEEYEEYPTNDLAPKFDAVIENEEDFEIETEDVEDVEEVLELEEYVKKVNKKFNIVKKKVGEINELIAKAIDKDGERLEVIDPTSTWEEPMYYEPITFENNVLTISYIEPYSSNKKLNTETVDLNVYLEDMDEKYFMLEDAKGDLAYIKRMYNKAIKKAKKEGNLAEETNNYSRDMVANELGIDASEFDDSSDLGMLADRIGEGKKTLKFGDFLNNKKK